MDNGLQGIRWSSETLNNDAFLQASRVFDGQFHRKELYYI